MRPTAEHRLVLFAHGSSDPRWCETIERLTLRLAADCGQPSVRLAYLQLAPPTLHDVVAEAARDGVHRLCVLPVFLSSGGHVAQDVPPLVEDARRQFPHLEIELLPPIGEDPRFAQLVCQVASEALGST